MIERINVVSWNIRGAGNEVARANVKKLLMETKANVLLLQETKCSDWDAIWTDGFWRGEDNKWEDSQAEGQSGGLLSSWLSADFQAVTVHKDRFWIWLRGLHNGSFINIGNVYGPLNRDLKEVVWNSLRELVIAFFNEPICLMGDFNCVCRREDRDNCIYNQRDTDRFNAFIKDCNLLEIVDVGVDFTWYGPANKKSKLDRVLVNDVWLAGRQWRIQKWSRRNSDHCPISLFVQTQDWGPKPFRGFNIWLQDEELKHLMHSEIANLCMKNNMDWFGILRGVKSLLKAWSRDRFDELNSSIVVLENNMKRLDEGLGSKLELDLVRSQLLEKYSLRNAMLKQKSRVKWDLEGDANSRFFHQSIQKRRSQNSIKGIFWQEAWVEDPHIVKAAFFDYFSSVFSERHGDLLFTLDDCMQTKLSRGDQETLERRFLWDEIDMALKEGSDNKAPGPDGLNFKWLKSILPDMEQKVMVFFEHFYDRGEFPSGANSSFISLIPKIKDAKHMYEFRPISLINCSIKLLFKVLANRLKPCLQSLIAEEQFAFLPGRFICDGILLANEVIHSMRKSGEDGIIMKIDFAKAYDSVNWNCLLHTLQCLNFGPKWQMWISAILHSIKMSVLINGSPSPEFIPGKGLRQGDPLAPYLFIIIGEILHCLLSKSARMGLVDGIVLSSQVDPVTHLQYADDTILFFKNNTKSIRCIKSVLLLFQIISGLKINFGKSFIYSACNDIHNLKECAAFLGCKVGKIPFPYLGAWIGKSPSQDDFWTPLVNKIRGKLAKWKCKALNEAGRLVLVRACLDGIPNYWLNLHKIPKGVSKRIDVIRRRFLWGEYYDPNSPCHRLHLIKWSSLTKPKSQGGLGLRDLGSHNLAFLGKWWWRFIKERDKKWHLILRSKYNLFHYLEDKCIRNPSPILKDILACNSHPCFLNLFQKSRWKWILGNGKRVLFWLDTWIGDRPLAISFRRLFLLSIDKDIYVHDMLSAWELQSSTKPIWRRPLRGWEIDIENSLGDILRSLELRSWDDRLIWRPNGGSYAVNFGYNQLVSHDADKKIWNTIWKIKTPHRIRIFLWKIVHKILPSRSFLNVRFRVNNLICSWCNREVEDQDHILWYCSGAAKVWSSCEAWWGVNIQNALARGSLEALLDLIAGALCKQAWEISIAATLWSLWLARNERIFKGSKISSADVFLLAKKRAFEWAKLANLIPQSSADIWALHPKSTSYVFLYQKKEQFMARLFKKYDFVAFTDGARSSGGMQRSSGGVGGIVYNKSKEVVFICFGPCHGLDVADIELEALKYIAMKISLNWPAKSAVICSDSSLAIKRFQQSKLSGLNFCGPILGSVFSEVDLSDIWACKIPKAWNGEADLFAKHGLKKNRVIEGFF